jgi:hypothetical protein
MPCYPLMSLKGACSIRHKSDTPSTTDFKVSQWFTVHVDLLFGAGTITGWGQYGPPKHQQHSPLPHGASTQKKNQHFAPGAKVLQQQLNCQSAFVDMSKNDTDWRDFCWIHLTHPSCTRSPSCVRLTHIEPELLWKVRFHVQVLWNITLLHTRKSSWSGKGFKLSPYLKANKSSSFTS